MAQSSRRTGSKATQVERVLEMLRDAGERGVTTGEFLQARLPRFSGRILELRQAGQEITTAREGEGSWRYTLITDSSAASRVGNGAGEQGSTPAGLGGATHAPGGELSTLSSAGATRPQNAMFDPWSEFA